MMLKSPPKWGFGTSRQRGQELRRGYQASPGSYDPKISNKFRTDPHIS